MPDTIAVEIGSDQKVSATVYPAAKPTHAGITLILGHGAGAGQGSSFMVSFAGALAARGIDTVTFNFLYMEQGRRLPDPKDKLEACYRAVIATIAQRLARPRPAGDRRQVHGRAHRHPGRGRWRPRGGGPRSPRLSAASSRQEGSAACQASGADRGADVVRAGRARRVRNAAGAAPIIKKLPAPAELFEVAGGDHSFKVLKRDGGNQQETYKAIQDRVDQWLRATLAP